MEKQIININIPNGEEKTTYQISVDDLDMSLLPMNRMSREYLKTLNQVDDDLCAFILYAEQKSNKHAIKHGDIKEGASTSSQTLSGTETTETYYCHICNLSIFKVHKKAHSSSDKHKTMLALAKHGLERINKHLSRADDDTEKETSSSNYCQPCNIRVEPKDISSHIDSDLHMISIKKDKLMSNLLNLYMDTVPTMDGTAKMNVLKMNNNKEHEQVDNKLSNYHACEICQVKVINTARNILEHYSGIKHTKNKIKQDDLAKVKEKSQPKVQAMSQQKCVNVVQKEETEMFRAVKRDKNVTKKIKYKCDVCKINLNSELCLRDHINGNQHKQVIESLKNSKIKTNENVTPHVTNVKPPKSNAKPNPTKTNNDKTSVSTSYHCPICNVKVPRNDKNISDHFNGKLHLNNVSERAKQGKIQDFILGGAILAMFRQSQY